MSIPSFPLQRLQTTKSKSHKRILPLKMYHITFALILLHCYRNFGVTDYNHEARTMTAVVKEQGARDNASDTGKPRELAFLHIPKTGGSTIVTASVPHNLSWGDCMFRNYTRHFHCSEYAFAHRPCPAIASRGIHVPGHIPMQYLKTHICNPYAGKDVFVVVRNPYDRWLSEYYYYCTKMTDTECDKTKLDDADYMNSWIQKRLRLKQKCDPEDKCYTRHANHEIAQYDYVYDTRNGKKPKRLVKWVLHQENLDIEFPELMERYGLNVTLPDGRINDNENTKELTVDDFDFETLSLIETIYQKDFDEFGYKRDRSQKLKAKGKRPR